MLRFRATVRYHAQFPTKYTGQEDDFQPFCATYDHSQAETVLGIQFKDTSEVGNNVATQGSLGVGVHVLDLVLVLVLGIRRRFASICQINISPDLLVF